MINVPEYVAKENISLFVSIWQNIVKRILLYLCDDAGDITDDVEGASIRAW